jgi:hypothetical protein
LNPAASHSFGPSKQSGSTARDQHAPVTIPPALHRSDAEISPATPTRGQRQLSAPPSTAKTQITQRGITVPVARAATKTTVALFAQPSFPFEIETSAQPPAPNPHSRPGAHRLRGSFIGGFRTPAPYLGQSLTPRRHLKPFPIPAAGSRPRERPESGAQAPWEKQ